MQPTTLTTTPSRHPYCYECSLGIPSNSLMSVQFYRTFSAYCTSWAFQPTGSFVNKCINYIAVEVHHTCKAPPWLAASVVATITSSKIFRNSNCEYIHLKAANNSKSKVTKLQCNRHYPHNSPSTSRTLSESELATMGIRLPHFLFKCLLDSKTEHFHNLHI